MIIINVFYCPLQVRLKYRDLYYKYRQKVDLLKVLKQEYDQPLASEPSVLADFFDFLRSGGVTSGEQVVVVANSAELLPLLRWKAIPLDVALIAGKMVMKIVIFIVVVDSVAQPEKVIIYFY